MNATNEQIERANKTVETSKGKLSFDYVLETIIKSDAKRDKKMSSKKNTAKWEQRKAVENSTFHVDDMGEYNRANALKNLPSSMR